MSEQLQRWGSSGRNSLGADTPEFTLSGTPETDGRIHRLREYTGEGYLSAQRHLNADGEPKFDDRSDYK
jgi:hypothetical protein